MTPVEAFHAHLDICPVCRTQPFSPCAEGARLLGAALVAAPVTRYECKQNCVTTGQPAPERCKHGGKQAA